jgi:hypothetical protein
VIPTEHALLRAFQEKSSVCVRLDGNPVTYEKKGNRLVFANIARPGSVVTIRYCLGKARCNELCEPGESKKDPFMTALGAEDAPNDKAEAAGVGQWDSADRDDGDAGTEFSDLLEVEKRQSRAALSLSSEWIPEAVTAGCSVTSVSTR